MEVKKEAFGSGWKMRGLEGTGLIAMVHGYHKSPPSPPGITSGFPDLCQINCWNRSKKPHGLAGALLEARGI